MRNAFTLILFLNFMIFSVSAQNKMMEFKNENYKSEFQRIQLEKNVKKKKGFANSLLNFYQSKLSPLIAADCVYQLSCSRFSRESIHKKGLFIGVLQTADRLTRCSYPCAKEIPDYKFNDEGLAEDNP